MMSLQAFEIEARNKLFEMGIPQIGDFKIKEAGSISQQELLENPGISLYCLDPDTQCAVFVETPTSVDLSQAPFYYMTQFKHATRVILTSYQVLQDLARQVPLEGEQLILVYSLGRCGSTLTSAAFSQAEGVIGLSEPDVFTQLVALRAWDGNNDHEISQLLKICTHLTCKNPVIKNKPQKWAIKFRSYGIEIADLMYQHFPSAKCLFLYRNLEGWLESMVRVSGGEGAITPELLHLFWGFIKTVVRMAGTYPGGNEALSISRVYGLHWLSPMDRYQYLADEGIEMLPVRFEDLKADTISVMEQIFAYCDVKAKDRDGLERIFEKDSQAGSLLAQDLYQNTDFESKEEIMTELQDLLENHPVINRPDHVFPGTLVLA